MQQMPDGPASPVMTARSPFDPPLEELRRMGRDVVELVARFVDQRYQAPAADYAELEPLLESLAGPPGEGGAPLGELLALVQLEASVLRWLCGVFGLPAGSQGVLTPGGSMANLSAIVTARTARLGEDFLAGTLYVSEQVHHSITKSARFAGLPAAAVRTVPTDDALRMDPGALRTAVREDRRAGRRPFLVVASAGTIGTGAVDPLEPIAEVAAEQDLWLHVDGAYGGCFQLTERGRALLAGIERADSITIDPHKGLFLPYGTGCLLARDGGALREAHEEFREYLAPRSADGALPDFTSYSPELTRDFRGLRLWLPLHLHGADASTTPR